LLLASAGRGLDAARGRVEAALGLAAALRFTDDDLLFFAGLTRAVAVDRERLDAAAVRLAPDVLRAPPDLLVVALPPVDLPAVDLVPVDLLAVDLLAEALLPLDLPAVDLLELARLDVLSALEMTLAAAFMALAASDIALVAVVIALVIAVMDLVVAAVLVATDFICLAAAVAWVAADATFVADALPVVEARVAVFLAAGAALDVVPADLRPAPTVLLTVVRPLADFAADVFLAVDFLAAVLFVRLAVPRLEVVRDALLVGT
jgi:hypothetical protein